MISRRSWMASSIGVASVGLTSLGLGPSGAAYARACVQEPGGSVLPPKFPVTDPELAQQIVGASHFDLPKVEQLLKTNPSLARATWDWGFGDWETALGAASHTGRIDIIQLLMGHGAAPTLFTLAALDRVDSVRAICTEQPGIQSQLGPHSITLFKHAEAGKASRVLEYLTGLGGADEGPTNQPLSEQAVQTYLGKYDFGLGTTDHFEVLIGKSVPRLGLRRTGASTRFLACLDPTEHRFTMFGSPQVRMAFQVAGEQATGFELVDGNIRVQAKRILS